MKIYDNIKPLRPYFYSLREVKNNVVLDLKIPNNWKFEEIISTIDNIDGKTQDKNHEVSLVSLFSSLTKEGYELIFESAYKIIQTNLEEEEKIRLFNSKVDELKELFLSSSLDKLKDISFIKEKKNVTHRKKSSMVGKRNENGSNNDGEPQEKID